MRKNVIDIRQYALRLKADKVYYFDKHYIYSCISSVDAEDKGFVNFSKRINGTYSIDDYSFFQFPNWPSNLSLCKKCICMLNLGDTLDTLEHYFKTVHLESRKKPEGLQRFITKINNPMFYRIPENPNPNTFDYIVVFVNTVKDWNEYKKDYIKKHIGEINSLVLEKIETNNQFQKYGIPLSFLKLSNITLTNDCTIKYVFELKEV